MTAVPSRAPGFREAALSLAAALLVAGAVVASLGRGGGAWLPVALRLASALAGGVLLARRLGLGRAGAGLASVAYGLSGAVVPCLEHPHGRVAAWLPWGLLLVEEVRLRRPFARTSGAVAGFALAALAPDGSAAPTFDVAALGLILVLAGLIGVFRRGVGRSTRARVTATLGLALAFGGVALALRARGLPGEASQALLPVPPDLAGVDEHRTSAWLAFVAWPLALAALLAPGGALRHRRLIAGLGLVAFLVVVRFPGISGFDAALSLPDAPWTLAPLAALMLGLIAGDGLEAAPRGARVTAVCVLAPLLAGAFLATRPSATGAPPEEDELVGFARTPSGRRAEEALEGWLAREVRLERARLVTERLDGRGDAVPGTSRAFPLAFHADPSTRARTDAPRAVAAAPEGARWFRSTVDPTADLADGDWSFRVEFLAEGGEDAAAVRAAGVATIRRASRRRAWMHLLLALAPTGLLLGALGRRSRGAVVFLAAAQGLVFAHLLLA